MRNIIITIFAIVFSVTVFAQTGSITGKVADSDGMSLAGANIYIEDLEMGTSTDYNGNFNLFKVPAGEKTVKVSYIGYQTQNITVTISAGMLSVLDITLEPGIVYGEEIYVMGERLKGQSKALNQQRENDNITNIVASDQIGRFPDQNIGDALKRIPAITVYYDQGEARFANLRGTDPKLNSIMINGERMPSAEAETRAVQLDLVSSNMIQSIEVNKTIMPDQDADAIGGSVNLITKQAPNKTRFSLTMGSGYNMLSEEPMWNGALTLGKRFFDDKVGVLISGSYYDHNLGSHNSEGEWDSDDGVIYPEEWNVRKYEIRRLRQSISAAFDWKINPVNTIYFNTIYTHRNDWENRFRLEYKNMTTVNADGYVPGVWDDGEEETELVRETKGGIDNSDNDNARLEDQRTYSFSLFGDHIFFSNLNVDWGVSYSKASEERPNERYIAYNTEGVFIRPDLSDVEKPYYTLFEHVDGAYQQVAMEDLEWELDELTEEYQWTEEKNLDLKLNFELPFNTTGDYQNKLKFGGKFKKKDKKRDNKFFEYSPVNDEFEDFLNAERIDKTVDDFLAGDYKSGEFADPEWLGSLDLENSTLFEKEDKPDEYAADNFTAEEQVIAAYAMWTQHFGPQLSIIAGVRFEATDVDYKGNEWNDDEEISTPTTGEDSYSNILPGLHVKYYLQENTILRFAWTNTLSRPDYYDLVPYRAIEDDEMELGNPELEPTTSMNFDLMAEHYLPGIGLLSGGVFYKQLKDYIYYKKMDDFVLNGNVYEAVQPFNGAEATLLGFEAAYQQQLTFLPGFWKNFGLYFNYTYTYSKADNPYLTEQVDDNEDIALPGTSPHTFNANLTYQDGTLTLGLSFNYTGAYLDPDEMDLTPGLERYYDASTYLDFSGSYEFTPQLLFYVEANNLLNQPLRFYAGESERTFQAEYYNRRFSAGVKFNL